MTEKERNDLQLTITHALQEMKQEAGDKFEIKKINLAELERRTNISRKRLRKIKDDDFIVNVHASKGKKKNQTVLSGFTGIIDSLLSKAVTNSSVIKDKLDDAGYTGSQTSIKNYISQHLDLVPAKRQIVASQGNRGRRYTTSPGESFQMDWGFVNVETNNGDSYKAACFAMICHHCGERYVEFFPNAKQENLFIGMLHAFQRMGVPKYVLTDNMKSVTTGRDSDGKPIWNNEYVAFMSAVGFETRLCKPRHPFTKGAVERLVQFVKDNFMAGAVFGCITDLNYDAIRWCDRQNNKYHSGVCCIPHEVHQSCCMKVALDLKMDDAVKLYLFPLRRISFDGFVTYEGRRFGVPYRYSGRTCRVSRQDYTLYVYSEDLKEKLTEHNVTWSRKDSFCKDQYVKVQPEEHPSQPVTTTIHQVIPPTAPSAFKKFDFSKEVEW